MPTTFKSTPLRLALVYDWINQFGGAERILLALHSLWPDAPIYTAVYSPHTSLWAKNFQVIPSFLNHLIPFRRHHQWLAPWLPIAFETFDFSAYDIVISVTSSAAKSILTLPHQLHLCYCLTPTRYLWSHTHAYLADQASFGRFLIAPYLASLRLQDYLAAKRPDYLIPISQHVARRISKYYRRQPEPVIYPPVDTVFFNSHPQKCFRHPSNYWLLVSRLVGYKNVSLVIEAFNHLPQHTLLIVGTGNQINRLRRQAKANIHFLGSISDTHLNCLYHHAQAVIFPQEEDFGIVPVEAQSAGTPVIAYDRGGARETIKPGVSGLLFSSLEPPSLISTVRAFLQRDWYDKAVMQQASQFGQDRFITHFLAKVEALWAQHQKKP